MPKDACYHKVKARYKVFPSAYASGAIAKCRKVGAANYGTGGKKKKKKDGGYETTMSDQGIENPRKKLGDAKSQLLRGLRDKERKDKKKGVMSRMPVLKGKKEDISKMPTRRAPQKKQLKAKNGLMAAIKKVDREQSMKAKEGKVVRMTKRKSSNKNIARGCGAIMSGRRKKTKYS